MRLFRKIIGLIQPHIVTVFSVLLFTSFAMVWLAFNFTVNRYIASGATDALREARATYEMVAARETGVVMRILRGNHRFMYANVRVFAVDSNFSAPENWLLSETVHVAERLTEMQLPMVLTEGMRLCINDQTFFISIVPTTMGALVFYLDVTEIFAFTAAVNRLLMVSVAMIWLISMIIAGILADSMMKPLRVLRDFVRQIGRGDFTPNSHSFANEELNELNQSLNNAVRQLAAYDNEQKTFFQNVSHELRTPLMSIKSYAEGIKQGIMDTKSASSIILEATGRLAGMVDDILYVSRLDSIAPPSMERANLCVIVEARVRQHRLSVESNLLEIKYLSDGEPIIVDCAAAYIERAVDNLISNAIRYAKTVITVECYAIGGSAIIRVTDDGSGFEPDALDHVFERFYRGKNGLTGIGLATVKSITDQHKGAATAENGKENGAVLTISIPR